MSVLGDEVRVAGRILRNRVVATAHGTAAVVDGMPTATDVAYWGRLARGGAGLVVAGGISVGRASTVRGRFLGEAWHPHAETAYRPKAEAITSAGAVALAQLCHLGRETLGAPTFLPFEAPSAVRSPREPAAARVLTTDDCAGVVASFVTSACRMIDAGFDGVELHGAHGYLLAQFLNPATNLRTDRYGGDRVGRGAVVVDIIAGIRRARPQALVSLRLSVEDDADGVDLDEVAEVAAVIHERSPVDLLDLTVGNRLSYVPDMATDRPPLLAIGDAGVLRSLRSSLGIPLLVCSAFRDREDLERVVLDGRADLVGMARPYLADPDVAQKLVAGRDDEVRPCVSCNEDCRAFDPVGLCVVNPDLAPPGETTRPAEPTRIGLPRRGPSVVTIVGGGPAGLEAALTVAAARPDLRVVLHERGDRLGGQLVAAGARGTRPGWGRLLGFYDHALRRAGVEVRLGSAVDPGSHDEERGGVLVWATGAVEDKPRLPAVSSTSFLLGGAATPAHVVVLDDGFGWWQSASAVEVALSRGARAVTVVTPGTAFAAALPPDSRAQLLRRLWGRQVEVVPMAVGTLELDGSVSATVNGSLLSRSIEADLVVRVGERRSLPLPAGSAWAIGDCVMPRRVAHAIAEGWELGRRLAGDRLDQAVRR